jgi:hypothetical protein
MATFTEIKELRLEISDPINVIDLLEVATSADLPDEPAQQAAYKVISSGVYVVTDKTSGAVPGDYEVIPLRISDARLAAWLDSLTYYQSKVQAIKAIISRLHNEYSLLKTQAGAEATEWNRILDILSFYKELLIIAQEEEAADSGTNTGRYSRTRNSRIAGGNV